MAPDSDDALRLDEPHVPFGNNERIAVALRRKQSARVAVPAEDESILFCENGGIDLLCPRPVVAVDFDDLHVGQPFPDMLEHERVGVAHVRENYGSRIHKKPPVFLYIGQTGGFVNDGTEAGF